MRRIQSVGATAVFILVAGCAGSIDGAPSDTNDVATVEAQIAYYDGCVASASADGLIDANSDCATRVRGLVSQVDVVHNLLGRDDEVVVRWTVRNDGAKTAWLPRWQAPKAELDDDVFQVSLGGQPVRYIGKHVKRRAPIPTDLVAIAPGRSLSATVKLSSFYDMGPAGEYVIQHQADVLAAFQGKSADAPALASNPVVAMRTEPSPSANAANAEPALAPAAAGLSYRNCSSSQKSAIASALSQADTYATNSQSYLDAGKTGSRYTTWFGTYSSNRYATARSHFTAIRSAIETKNITVDCGCTDDYYAYVYPNQPYIIYVCNAFQSAPISGTDSKAGTLIHELSHFYVVASTDDRAYGQSACMSLARRSPANALDNADSHEYFAENNPARN
jgi:peptidyl-Lys metalloendopeptidase